MAKIVLTESFLQELKEIVDYLKFIAGEVVASSTYNKILDAISLLELFPYSGHVVYQETNGYTIYRIIKGRYNLFYTIENRTVFLLSVRDGKRQNKYPN